MLITVIGYFTFSAINITLPASLDWATAFRYLTFELVGFEFLALVATFARGNFVLIVSLWMLLYLVILEGQRWKGWEVRFPSAGRCPIWVKKPRVKKDNQSQSGGRVHNVPVKQHQGQSCCAYCGSELSGDVLGDRAFTAGTHKGRGSPGATATGFGNTVQRVHSRNVTARQRVKHELQCSSCRLGDELEYWKSRAFTAENPARAPIDSNLAEPEEPSNIGNSRGGQVKTPILGSTVFGQQATRQNTVKTPKVIIPKSREIVMTTGEEEEEGNGSDEQEVRQRKRRHGQREEGSWVVRLRDDEVRLSSSD